MVLFNVLNLDNNGTKMIEFLGSGTYKRIVVETGLLSPEDRGLFALVNDKLGSGYEHNRATMNSIYTGDIPWLSNDFGEQLFHGAPMQDVINAILNGGGKVFEGDDINDLFSDKLKKRGLM